MNLLNTMKTMCKSHGISIAELERSAGLSHSSVARWDRNIPSVDKVAAVADFFGVTIDEMLGRSAPEISAEDRQILELFHQLNEDGQGAAIAMLQGLARQSGYIKSDRAEELGA